VHGAFNGVCLLACSFDLLACSCGSLAWRLPGLLGGFAWDSRAAPLTSTNPAHSRFTGRVAQYLSTVIGSVTGEVLNEWGPSDRA